MKDKLFEELVASIRVEARAAGLIACRRRLLPEGRFSAADAVRSATAPKLKQTRPDMALVGPLALAILLAKKNQASDFKLTSVVASLSSVNFNRSLFFQRLRDLGVSVFQLMGLQSPHF